MGEFLIPYLPSGLITLSPGQRFPFPIPVDYLLFESLTDLSGGNLDPTLTIQLENAQAFKLPSLLQVILNKQENNLRFSVVNENSFSVSFNVAGGRGDVDNQRSQVVGSVTTAVNWGAAYSDTVLEAISPPSFTTVGFSWTEKIIHVGNKVINIIGFNTDHRIMTISMKEDSGIPNAWIAACRNSGVARATSHLVCESGQSVVLPKPIYINNATNSLYVVFGNGALGEIDIQYQVKPVPSGGS